MSDIERVARLQAEINSLRELVNVHDAARRWEETAHNQTGCALRAAEARAYAAEAERDRLAAEHVPEQCPDCNGRGFIYDGTDSGEQDECQTCGGRRVLTPRVLERVRFEQDVAESRSAATSWRITAEELAAKLAARHTPEQVAARVAEALSRSGRCVWYGGPKSQTVGSHLVALEQAVRDAMEGDHAT